MENQIEILNNEDVVSTESTWLLGNKTSTVEEFLEAACKQLYINGEGCYGEGLVKTEDCKVLRVGELQGWRKGQLKVRVKVILEFEPAPLPEDDSNELSASFESPLDRLRS
jgi:KGK domain